MIVSGPIDGFNFNSILQIVRILKIRGLERREPFSSLLIATVRLVRQSFHLRAQGKDSRPIDSQISSSPEVLDTALPFIDEFITSPWQFIEISKSIRILDHIKEIRFGSWRNYN